VGVLWPSESVRGAYAFQYDPKWSAGGLELAPTLMPVTQAGVFTFPDLPARTYYGLPPMLADSAPDNFGNAIINAALLSEGVSPGDVTPLDRLAYVGSRGMGALTFVPDTSPGDLPTSVQLAELVESARDAVSGSLVDRDARSLALRRLLAVGTSAGGARAKAIIAWNRDTGQMKAGGISAPDGFEQWLLKFDGVGDTGSMGDSQGHTRIEYAYYLMAKDAGIDMSESAILEEGGRSHFATRRFDRPGQSGARLHMQSLCAVEALDFNAINVHSYDSYFAAMESLKLADSESREEAFRRVVFNVLAFNNDDHTKNFAFLMNEDGEWSLAPAYDQTFAYNPNGVWTKQHLMSVGKKFKDITNNDLADLAVRNQVPEYRKNIEMVTEAVSRWEQHADEAEVSEENREKIARHLGSGKKTNAVLPAPVFESKTTKVSGSVRCPKQVTSTGRPCILGVNHRGHCRGR
jgi:serine/threonine-protein kinase HipA